MRYIVKRSSGEIIPVDEVQSRYFRMCKRVFSWSSVVSQYDVDLYMVTLTYRVDRKWNKGDISRFMEHFRVGQKIAFVSGILGYAWVAEMQQRKEVHYHIIFAVQKGSPFYTAVIDRKRRLVKQGIGFPDDLGHWNNGSTGVDVAKTPFYIVAYVSKEKQKFADFPKGCRTYGLYLNKKMIRDLDIQRHHVSIAPKWLDDIIRASPDLYGKKISRSTGGFYVGELFIPSPYDVGFTRNEILYKFDGSRWGLTGEIGIHELDTLNGYLSLIDKVDLGIDGWDEVL